MRVKKHICIITQSHLCRNPRVVKEAKTLSAQYKITIINSTFSKELSIQDGELIKGFDIEVLTIAKLQDNNFASWFYRLVKRMAGCMVKKLSVQTPFALGYAAKRYLPAALKLNADAYICHQELGLYCGTKLLKHHKNIAFDFEDWYSEDLPLQSRSERPVLLLKKAETTALKYGGYCITTSNVLAAKLSEVYKSKAPGVIYNVFNSRKDLLLKEKDFSDPLKLFWFSQTIGPGRGLERFIKLTTAIKTRLELHLLGNITTEYKTYLNEALPLQHNLYFHDVVPDQGLASKIAEFDIGLALELNTPLSRDYTITNKFFQYLQAGLPVIATETHGQNEAFEKLRPGFMLSQAPDKDEMTRLANWLNNKAELVAARKRAIEAAKYYNWEIESEKLLAHVEKLLGNYELQIDHK